MIFRSYMDAALTEARAAATRDEVPVGAVVVSPEGRVVAQAGNEMRARNDPTAHAEVLAIRAACAVLEQERLTGHDLWVTLEPCPMCATAISFARIRRVYYGAGDEKLGGVDHGPRLYAPPTRLYTPEVYGGVAEAECAALLTDFFARKRGLSGGP